MRAALDSISVGGVPKQERSLVAWVKLACIQAMRRSYRQVQRVAARQQLAVALGAVGWGGQRRGAGGAAIQVAIVAGRVTADPHKYVPDARTVTVAWDMQIVPDHKIGAGLGDRADRGVQHIIGVGN